MSQTKHSSKFKLLLPSDLDLAKIVLNNPPDFEVSLDLLSYFVHLNFAIPARKTELLDKDGFVPFNAQIMQTKSRAYREHLDFLVEQGVLDEYRSYIPGKKSRRFRIAEQYLSSRLKEVVIKDGSLIKQIERNSKLDFGATIKYKCLYKWFNPDKLKIDGETAREYIYNELAETKDKCYYHAYITAYIKLLKVKMLEEGTFWFNVDATGHRLHTNLTNLNKDLKPFITYDGKTLVSIDIKNSQPFFSLKILEERQTIQNKTNTKQTTHNKDTHPIILVEPIVTVDYDDVTRYKAEVVNGTFYELLEAEMRKEFGDTYFNRPWIFDVSKKQVVKNPFRPRQLTKGVTYQIFFSKNESITKEKELFRRLFPNVMGVFEDYKGNIHLSEKDRHTRLAKRLQRIEASVVLDKVVKAISKLRPDLPLYTIHDSIVTTSGNDQFVEQVTNKIVTEAMGCSPTMTIEHWRNDCVELKKAA